MIYDDAVELIGAYKDNLITLPLLAKIFAEHDGLDEAELAHDNGLLTLKDYLTIAEEMYDRQGPAPADAPVAPPVAQFSLSALREPFSLFKLREPVMQWTFDPSEPRDFHGHWIGKGMGAVFAGNEAYQRGSHRGRMEYHMAEKAKHVHIAEEAKMRADEAKVAGDKAEKKAATDLFNEHHQLAGMHERERVKERNAAKESRQLFTVGGEGDTLGTVSTSKDFLHFDPSAEKKQLDHLANLGAHKPLTQEDMINNTRQFFRRAGIVRGKPGDTHYHPDLRNDPRMIHWYRDDAKANLDHAAQVLGYDKHDMYAMAAVMSPMREWGDNKDSAISVAYYAKHLDEYSHHYSVEDAKKFNERNAKQIADGVTTAMPLVDRTPKLSELDNFTIAATSELPMLHMNPDGTMTKIEALTKGQDDKHLNGASGPLNTMAAFDVARGVRTKDEILGGPKVRNFYNNILNEDDPRFVTVDTWMLRGMIWDHPIKTAKLGPMDGRHWQASWLEPKLGKDGKPKLDAKGREIKEKKGNAIMDYFSKPANAEIPDRAGTYGVTADVIREAARRDNAAFGTDLTPAQYQAVVWNQLRYEDGWGLPWENRKAQGPIPPSLEHFATESGGGGKSPFRSGVRRAIEGPLTDQEAGGHIDRIQSELKRYTDWINRKQPSVVQPQRLQGDSPQLRDLSSKIQAALDRMGVSMMSISPEQMASMMGRDSTLGVTMYDLEGRPRTVFIRNDTSPNQQTKTLAHELVHASMHTGLPSENPTTRELDAETLASGILRHYGYDSKVYSVPYVLGHAATHERRTMASLEQSTYLRDNRERLASIMARIDKAIQGGSE